MGEVEDAHHAGDDAESQHYEDNDGSEAQDFEGGVQRAFHALTCLVRGGSKRYSKGSTMIVPQSRWRQRQVTPQRLYMSLYRTGSGRGRCGVTPERSGRARPTHQPKRDNETGTSNHGGRVEHTLIACRAEVSVSLSRH